VRIRANRGGGEDRQPDDAEHPCHAAFPVEEIQSGADLRAVTGQERGGDRDHRSCCLIGRQQVSGAREEQQGQWSEAQEERERERRPQQEALGSVEPVDGAADVGQHFALSPPAPRFGTIAMRIAKVTRER
jgi:hypothetical protein